MRAGAIVGNLGLPHDVEISAFALSGRNIGVHGNPTPVCAYLPTLLGTAGTSLPPLLLSTKPPWCPVNSVRVRL